MLYGASGKARIGSDFRLDVHFLPLLLPDIGTWAKWPEPWKLSLICECDFEDRNHTSGQCNEKEGSVLVDLGAATHALGCLPSDFY